MPPPLERPHAPPERAVRLRDDAEDAAGAVVRATAVPGEPARIAMSGLEVEVVMFSVVPGLLTVKRTPAKVTSQEGSRKRKREA